MDGIDDLLRAKRRRLRDMSARSARRAWILRETRAQDGAIRRMLEGKMLLARIGGAVVRPSGTGDRGACPLCDGEVAARFRAGATPHWFHMPSAPPCPHGGGETEWHLRRKIAFLAHEGCDVEVPHTFRGERHVADVVTPHRYVEIQQSSISPEEAHSREMAYGSRLVWLFRETVSRRTRRRLRHVWVDSGSAQELGPVRREVDGSGTGPEITWEAFVRHVTSTSMVQEAEAKVALLLRRQAGGQEVGADLARAQRRLGRELRDAARSPRIRRIQPPPPPEVEGVDVLDLWGV